LVVRKLAAIALAAGVLVSATGCSFNPHPDTLQSYAPSDGEGIELKVTRNETLALRNFLILTDGTTFKLYGSIINSGNKAEKVTIQLADDATNNQTFDVAVGQTVGLGYANGVESTLKLSGKPGQLTKIEITADGGKNWTSLNVPVLDGTIDYYKQLVDGFGTSTGTPSATPAASPSATAK
jgi:hypothetical protein